MIIGICGHGFTGSGAILDLLKEFDNTNVIDNGEFDIPYIPDGLEDLEYHIKLNPTRLGSDAAIKRFLRLAKAKCRIRNTRRLFNQDKSNEFYRISMRYVKTLTTVEWNGFWTFDSLTRKTVKEKFSFTVILRLLRYFQNKHKKAIRVSPFKKMYLSYTTNFDKITQKYVKEVLAYLGADSDLINVLDQPFSSIKPENDFHFFPEECKAIIVERDPRDIYIMAKKVYPIDMGFIPSDNVTEFISYYKNQRELAKNTNSQNILKIHFEDLIYDYDKTVESISNFLLLGKQIKQRIFFKPDVSIHNTQLFRNYPELKDDMKKIEESLGEYLYDFLNIDLFSNTNNIVF